MLLGVFVKSYYDNKIKKVEAEILEKEIEKDETIGMNEAAAKLLLDQEVFRNSILGMLKKHEERDQAKEAVIKSLNNEINTLREQVSSLESTLLTLVDYRDRYMALCKVVSDDVVKQFEDLYDHRMEEGNKAS